MPIADKDFDPSFLEIAVQYNDLNEAKRLLEQASFSQRRVLIEHNGYGAFHHAATHGRTDFLELIMAKAISNTLPFLQFPSALLNNSILSYGKILFLLSGYSDARYDIISHNSYHDFRMALAYGHPGVVSLILKNAFDLERENMINEAINSTSRVFGYKGIDQVPMVDNKINTIKIVLEYANQNQKMKILSGFAREFTDMAVQSNNISFLVYILHEIEPDKKADIVECILRKASRENKPSILTHYLGLFDDERRQEIVLKNTFFFYTDHLSVFKLLFDYLDDKNQSKLLIENPRIFESACEHGRTEIADFILSRLIEEGQLEVIKIALSIAVQYGQVSVVKLLFDRIGATDLRIDNDEVIKAVIGDNRCFNRKFKIIRYLLQTMPFTEIRNLLEKNNFIVFHLAVDNDDANLIELLFNKMDSSDLLDCMIKFNNYEIFYYIKTLKVFKLLSDKVKPENLQEIIARNNFHLFLRKVENASDDLCEHLIKITDPGKLQNMLSSVTYDDFLHLIYRRRYKTISLILEKIDSAQKKNMISARSYFCFRRAASDGDADIVELLLKEVDPLQKQAMIASCTLSAQHDCLGVLKLLYKHVDPGRRHELFRVLLASSSDSTLDFLLSLDPSYKVHLSKTQMKGLELYRKRIFEISSALMSCGLPSEISNLITQYDSPVHGKAKTKNEQGHRQTLLTRYSDIWHQKETRIREESKAAPEGANPEPYNIMAN